MSKTPPGYMRCENCEAQIRKIDELICDRCSKTFCAKCVIELEDGSRECPHCNAELP